MALEDEEEEEEDVEAGGEVRRALILERTEQVRYTCFRTPLILSSKLPKLGGGIHVYIHLHTFPAQKQTAGCAALLYKLRAHIHNRPAAC